MTESGSKVDMMEVVDFSRASYGGLISHPFPLTDQGRSNTFPHLMCKLPVHARRELSSRLTAPRLCAYMHPATRVGQCAR